MAPSKTSLIGAAIVAKLLADATLMAMVEGIWYGFAPQGKTRFIVYARRGHVDDPMFAADADHTKTRAFEVQIYQVWAVMKDTAKTRAVAAGERIDALLENATLSVSGYSDVTVTRTDVLDESEPDDDGDERWQKFGGLYEVTAAPT